MENESPKYLLYFSLNGMVSYDETEFNTIRKFVNNIISTRYYQLELVVQFNEEIINYEAIKKQLPSDNIMLLMGQINDELVDDVIYEIICVLGVDKYLRHRSINDFNNTGYSDEQLNTMYDEYLENSKQIVLHENSLDDVDFKNINKDFCYFNLPYLKKDNYLNFCELLLKNVNNLDSFEVLQDYSVLEALFTHFTYFIKYLDMLNLHEIILYYNKDAAKILRSLRFYVKQSEEYNDDIKELFVYKFLLNKLGIKQFYFNPEEGYSTIREEIDKIIDVRNQEIIKDFIKRVKLSDSHYEILNIADNEVKTFKSYKFIAQNIIKHLDKLKPLLKSFKTIDNNFVKFNSKMNNLDRLRVSLDRLKRYRLVKEYQEKYGLFNITLESSEHIPFLQGRWFEYYTAGVCEEIIQSYKSQGYSPDYQIYQNVMLEINGAKRELDIIIYLNGHIFYIENKVESKSAYKTDIQKYKDNSENMNLNPNNCYLVYLDGEDKTSEFIKVCSFKTFEGRFRREVLRILEDDKQTQQAKLITEQKETKAREMANKLLEKERNSLYLRYYLDETEEEKKILKVISKYDEELKKINLVNKNNFFMETLSSLNKIELIKSFQDFQLKYEKDYNHKITLKKIDVNFFKQMIQDLDNLGKDNALINAKEKLLCLCEDIDAFLSIGTTTVLNKLGILCGYGNHVKNYYEIIISFLKFDIPFTFHNGSSLMIQYIKSLDERIIRNPIITIDFALFLNEYLENMKKNSAFKNIINYRKEVEFIAVLIYTFMIKHTKTYSLQGLSLEHIEGFIYRMMFNQFTFDESIKSKAWCSSLLTFKIVKLAYFNPKYIDVASYLYLNYKALKEELKNIVTSNQKHFLIEATRSEQVGKWLRLSNEAGLISAYKEVKKANKYIAILSGNDAYQWITNYCWLGTYLSFLFTEDHLLTNLQIDNGNIPFQVLFYKTITDVIYLCLGKMIDNQYLTAIIKTTEKDFSQTIEEIKDNDFNISIMDIKEKWTQIYIALEKRG